MDRFLILAPAMPLHKKLVLLAILKLVNCNRPTTTVKEITNTYFQICEKIGETPRHGTTISNSISELTIIGMIKEVSIKNGREASGREIEIDVLSGKALEEFLDRNHRLEDVRYMKPVPFPKSRYINAPNSNFITK
jgi:Cdc6-like AAA superfamily ATPase